MIKILHAIPYYHYSVSNWKEKKQKMIAAMYHQQFCRNGIDRMSFFSTDRPNPRFYIDDFLSIFQEELMEFGQELNLNKFKIEDIWTVKYETGDFHSIHNHSKSNISGILYFDYDEKEHTPTNILVGENSITKVTDVVTPSVVEGDIILFPSNMMHFTLPNKSNKVRTVVSFDISLV
jgi:co-chaperonin GroES (HSP10)